MNEAADVKRDPQFFRVGSSVVKEGAVKAMTAVDLKVYLVLALHANWRTGRCWPSYRTIRELSGCSFDCIADAIRRLVGLGAISAQRDKIKRGRRNSYTVHRVIQPTSGICSERTEDPPSKQNRDAKGRFFRPSVSAFPAIEPPADANFADFPCNHSGGTDDPPAAVTRDKSDRYRSERTEDLCSERTEDLCSDGTEQNEIHLNESNRTRSKENAPSAPSRGNGRSPEAGSRPALSISESTIREYLKIKSKAEVLEMLKKGNHPIPEFLLTEQKDHNEEQGRDILGEVMGR